MIRPTTSKLIFFILVFFASQTMVMASDDHDRDRDRDKSLCEVVSINGTGKLLEDGRIVGAEKLSIIGTGMSIEVSFLTTPLGVLEVNQATGVVTLSASHDFTSVKGRSVKFTTFDAITIVPLGGIDATCVNNACGLIFKLKLETGDGRYNCGEIVSGFNTDPTAPIPFTSFVNPSSPAPNGDTVFLNSLGKLCKCSGNN